jgi:hypothetical protein
MNEATADASKNSLSSKEVFVQDGWTKQTDESQIESFAFEFDTLQEATFLSKMKRAATPTPSGVGIATLSIFEIGICPSEAPNVVVWSGGSHRMRSLCECA